MVRSFFWMLFFPGILGFSQVSTYFQNNSAEAWTLKAQEGRVEVLLSRGLDKHDLGRTVKATLDQDSVLRVEPGTTLKLDLFQKEKKTAILSLLVLDHNQQNPFTTTALLRYQVDESLPGCSPLQGRDRLAQSGLPAETLTLLSRLLYLEADTFSINADDYQTLFDPASDLAPLASNWGSPLPGAFPSPPPPVPLPQATGAPEAPLRPEHPLAAVQVLNHTSQECMLLLRELDHKVYLWSELQTRAEVLGPDESGRCHLILPHSSITLAFASLEAPLTQTFTLANLNGFELGREVAVAWTLQGESSALLAHLPPLADAEDSSGRRLPPPLVRLDAQNSLTIFPRPGDD